MSKKTQFTWEELSSLNTQQNAHVAVREKVIFKRPIYIPTFDLQCIKVVIYDIFFSGVWC